MFKMLITTAAVVMVVAAGTATAGTTPQGLKADGLRYQAMAERYQQMRYYTPQALEADGLRWQAMARAYASRPVVSASGGTGFHWGDAGIGAAGGVVLFACGGIAVLFARRSRRAKLAV
jgi:hypothetical protein